MINQDIIAQDLFYKIRGRFPSMEMGDEKSLPTFEASKGRFFDFDAIFDDVNLGKVSVSINEPGRLKIYFNRSIVEDADEATSKHWFGFLKEMRKFAMKRLMSLDARDIGKSNLDKRDYGYLAKKEPIMSESAMRGTSRTSYKPLEKTKLIIRHSKPVDESIPGSRSRHIESLFIENESGERFKYPFPHKLGAECMQRHVANGGLPHDDVGKSIVEMSKNIAELASFKRYVGRHDLMNSDTNDIVDRANEKLLSLKETMHKITKQHHYESYKEGFTSTISGVNGDNIAIDEIAMEDFKDKFTVKSFQENIADVFPLLHKIMQETSELNLEDVVGEQVEESVDEQLYYGPEDQFNEWAEEIVENGLENGVSITSAGALDEATSAPVLTQVSGGNFTLEADGQTYNVTATVERDGTEYDDPVYWSDVTITDAGGQPVENPALEDEVQQMLDDQFADQAMELQGENDVDAGDAAYDSYKDSQYEGQGMPNQELNDIRKLSGLKQDESIAEVPQAPSVAEAGDDQTPDERKAANEYVMSVARAIKSGEVQPEEVEQEFFHTLPMMGVNDEKVMQMWDRINGSEAPRQKRDVPSDRDIDAELKGVNGGDDDSDDAFLNKLRGQAKHGSIKADDTGFGSETEGAEELERDDKDEITEKASTKEVAKFIMGFYDRERGTFPLGETGVQVKVEKKFGEEAGNLAAQLIAKLSSRGQRDAFEDIRRLSGLPTITEASKKAKKDYDKDGKVESEKDEHAGSVDNAIKKSKTEESVDFADLMVLSGLKK